jgi:hypothetical protein
MLLPNDFDLILSSLQLPLSREVREVLSGRPAERRENSLVVT